jgi:hypothetical protein
MLLFVLGGALLMLGGCGTSASVNLTTPDGIEFQADLSDFKDRESINIAVERDPATGRVTGFTLQSTNSLTSPVAAVQAEALLEMADVAARLASLARPVP